MKVLSMKWLLRFVPIDDVAADVLKNIRDVDRTTLGELKATLRDYNAKRKLWASEIEREYVFNDIKLMAEKPPDTDPEAECT